MSEGYNQAKQAEKRIFDWRKYKTFRQIQWSIQSLMGRVGSKTAKYESYTNYNKFLAGLHQLTWTYFCGYGWKFAFKMAWIYWKPKFRSKP